MQKRQTEIVHEHQLDSGHNVYLIKNTDRMERESWSVQVAVTSKLSQEYRHVIFDMISQDKAEMFFAEFVDDPFNDIATTP